MEPIINRNVADNNIRIRQNGIEGLIVKTDNIGCDIKWQDIAYPIWYSYGEINDDTEWTWGPAN